MKKFNAAIIGAGKIGAFFDTPKDKKILTHAHAYKKHPNFNLIGFVDADLKQAQKASKMWGGKAFSKIEDLFKDEKVDVVSICTPESDHFRSLSKIKNFSIKGGIIEKPLTSGLKDSKEILNDEYFKQRPFLVNYIRRFVPDFQNLKEEIETNKFGNFILGNIYYGKGLLHNGSHAIDLLGFFGLEVVKSESLSKIKDFYEDDLSYSGRLFIKNGGVVNLNVVPANKYKLFELDLIFEKGRIKILNDGFEIEKYNVSDDKNFKGYKALNPGVRYKTSLGKYMFFVVQNLYDSINKKTKPLSSIESSLKTQRICESFKKS